MNRLQITKRDYPFCHADSPFSHHHSDGEIQRRVHIKRLKKSGNYDTLMAHRESCVGIDTLRSVSGLSSLSVVLLVFPKDVAVGRCTTSVKIKPKITVTPK